ncbi:MAG: lipoate--protein ligase family protein, partial [Desulfomonilaceae bacterium]
MALDQIILDEVGEGHSPPTLRFLQFDPPAALVGYHQDVDLEIRTDFCAENGIDVNRRLTGGGSIFFQDSALGWEVFGQAGQTPFRGSFEEILQRICAIAADAISRVGIPAQYRPRNDIEVQGRKISGTGGVFASGAYMFQGTLLVKNEIDLFLKALRVPVEKLKKREIESLMERVCFLDELVRPCPDVSRLKRILAHEFSRQLTQDFEYGELTVREQARLQQELSYFQSPAWIRRTKRPSNEGIPCRSIMQTDAGTLRVHIWLSPGGKTVRQALICGDFFAAPNRL